MMPPFSVIVPTRNRNDDLARCLKQLQPGVQTVSPTEYEVIVTDDGDRASELSEAFPSVRFLRGPQRGPAANRNNGAKHATGEWLVFTDDDCIPDSTWLEGFQRAMKRHPEAAVLEGRTYPDRPRQTLAEHSPVNETGGVLWSCNFAIRRDVFNSIGRFNERFTLAAMEDVELRHRLKLAGYAFPFIPEASVCHPWRKRGGWREFKKVQSAFFVYHALNPAAESALRYFESVAVFCLRNLPRAISEYKGRGLHVELLWQLGLLQTGMIVGGKKVLEAFAFRRGPQDSARPPS